MTESREPPKIPDHRPTADASPARRVRLRRALAPVLAALAVAGAVGGGWYWWTVGRFIEATDDAYVRSDVAVISPEIEGYVRTVRVADNQGVRPGDVLVTIDDRDFKAKVAATEADLAAKAAASRTWPARSRSSSR